MSLAFASGFTKHRYHDRFRPVRFARLWAGLLFLTAGTVAAELPPIRSASEIAYPPFCLVDAQGRADGFSVELLRESLRAMDRDVDFRVAEWAEVRGWLERGEVDALPLVGRTPERETLFDFTFPYMTLFGAIVVRTDTTGIASLDDLRGLRVAVMRGDNAEEFLRREDRGIDIRTTPTFEQAFRELSAGRHDAVVVQRLVAIRLLHDTGLENLRIIPRPLNAFRQDFCFAVRKGDADTLSLINEGLALVIADGTYRRLHAKWFSALELPSDRRIIIGGDHAFPPYEYLNADGLPEGFTVDLSRALAREMRMDIEFRLEPWNEAVRALETGEIDMLQGVFYSEERSRRLDFTVPHSYQHYVSVMRTGAGPPPESFAELQGLSVAVQEGDLIHEQLEEHGLSGSVLTVENQEEVLEAVADGRADCGLVMRLSAARILDSRRMDLVLGRRPVYSAAYCMAVRKGNSALLTQLNEGLRILQETGEYRRIQEKWLGVLYETPPLWRVVARYLGWVAGPILAVFALILLWNGMLRSQVTERTRELREREAFFHTVLDNLPVGVAVNTLDSDSRPEYMNELFPEYYRTTRDAIPTIEAFWNEVYRDPEYRKQIRERVEKDCASGDPERMYWPDLPITRKGEETTYITARNAQIPGSHRMISLAWDVTDRKKAEEELAAQYRLIRVAGETVRFGGWSVDFVANRCTWSDVVAEIHEMPPGYAPSVEEAIAFYAPEWRKRITRVFNTCGDHGTPYDEEMQILTRTGKRVWVRTSGEAIRNEQGDIVQIQGSFQDITERKHAEMRIRHLNHVLRAVRDVNQLIVRERDSDNLIREACRLMVDCRGYSSAIVVLTGETQRADKWAAEGIAAQSGPLRAALDRGELPPCCDPACVTSDGLLIADRKRICGDCPLVQPCRDAISVAVRLTHKDQTYGYLVVAIEMPQSLDEEERDLLNEVADDLGYALHNLEVEAARLESERQKDRLQTQLNEAQKMEAVGRLAGGVAHDFNNLLMGILGYVDLARNSLPPDHPAREDLNAVTANAERSAALTRQLLTFARCQTVTPKLLDLNENITFMLKLLQQMLGEDIDLAWMPGRDAAPVMMDPSQVDQILANLCVNARDAIAGVGKLTIETENVTIDAAYCEQHAEAVPGDFVMLGVSDSGNGISRETLRHIFEPFFTTKTKGHGTGLGLATVYGIVKQNNGFINVYSEVGKGTTFKIYLPMAKGDDARFPDDESTAPVPVGGTENILLAEDEAAILDIIKRYLQYMGYTVLAVSSPEEALQLAGSHAGSIPLLITDVVMPGMSGRDLSDRLRQMRPEIKTLFISGYTANAIAHQGVLDKGIAFLQKPVTMAELSVKVRSMLDTR